MEVQQENPNKHTGAYAASRVSHARLPETLNVRFGEGRRPMQA